MKTIELLKWLKERHIDATETEYTITTHTGFTVYKDRVGVIKFHNSNTFNTEIVAKLVEYMDTPLEDRKEEKKYKVKCKITGRYLDKVGHNKVDWNFLKSSVMVFTLKELKDLGINTEHYDLEEVE